MPSSVDRLLGGLDDFLKEARRSAEAAPRPLTESHTGLVQSTAQTQQAPNQQAINQAASEKWKKWKRERELKENLKKIEQEILQQRYVKISTNLSL